MQKKKARSINASILLVIGTFLFGCTNLIWLIQRHQPQILPHIAISAETLPNNAIIRMGHGLIHSMAYAPDGNVLAVGTAVGISFFDSADYSLQRRITTDIQVDALAWSPNQQMIAFTNGSSAFLLNLTTDTWIKLTTDGTQLYDEISWSPDGNHVSAIYKRDIRVWNKDGKVVKGLRHNRTTFRGESVAWSPDGTQLVAAYSDFWVGRDDPDEVVIWDFASGNVVEQWEMPRSSSGKVWWTIQDMIIVNNDIFRRDGTRVAGDVEVEAISADGTTILKVAESDSAELITLPTLEPDNYVKLYGSIIAWHPNRQIVASATHFDDKVAIHSVSSDAVVAELFFGSHLFESIAWSPNGQYVAGITRRGSVLIYSARDSEIVSEFRMGRGTPHRGIGFSADGSLLAIGVPSANDHHIELWTVEGDLINTIQGGALFAWSPTTAQIALATGSKIERFRIEPNGTADLIDVFKLEGGATAISWSGDGNTIAVGIKNFDKERAMVQLWQMVDHHLPTIIQDRHMQSRRSYIRSIALSPNGKWVAASYDSGEYNRSHAVLSVWDLEGNLVKSFGNQEQSSWSLSWHANSQWLVSTDAPIERAGIGFYPLADEHSIKTLAIASNTIAWSPNGKSIASVGFTGQPVFIDVDALRLNQ